MLPWLYFPIYNKYPTHQGEDTPVTDTLSHLGAIHYDTCPLISFQDIAKAQHDNPELSELQSFFYLTEFTGYSTSNV